MDPSVTLRGLMVRGEDRTTHAPRKCFAINCDGESQSGLTHIEGHAEAVFRSETLMMFAMTKVAFPEMLGGPLKAPEAASLACPGLNHWLRLFYDFDAPHGLNPRFPAQPDP